MAYKALYRTYRPQTFSKVIGQDVIVKTLQNAIKNNRVSHAYLFCGPRGTGKTTIARIFAKALNCQNLQINDPCNECASCQEITNGISPNVIEIDAASNNGVDEIRDLKEKVNFLPAGAKYKIYIIDEVHMLSTSAFNALLKTLEEPPKHIIFILATTEPQKVLPTIISRCQRFDFKALQVNDLVKALTNVCKNEDIKYDDLAIEKIAIGSDGGFRDALSYLDQAIALSDSKITEEIADDVTGLVSNKTLLDLAKSIEDKKVNETLEIIQNLQNSGREIGKILNSMLRFYRDLLLCKNISTCFNDNIVDFSKTIDLKKIYYNINVLSDVQSKIKYGNTPEIYFEVAMIKMINASNDILDYGERITKLEKDFKGIDGLAITQDENVDNGKLKLLEEKFNNLCIELSKLEIPKLAEKVKQIETIENNNTPINIPNIKEINARVDKIIEDLELLKVIQNSFKSELDNAQTGDIDEEMLTDKIDEAIKKVKPSINYSEVENFIKKQLEYFEEKINNDKNYSNVVSESDLNNRINEIINNQPIKSQNNENDVEKLKEYFKNELAIFEKEITERIDNQILTNENDGSGINVDEIIKNINSKNDYSEIKDYVKFELDNFEQKFNQKFTNQSTVINSNQNKIDEDSNINMRLSKIESNIYKIMADLLASQPAPKKIRNKIDDKQISIWKDEIVDVDRINNPNVNEQVDFGSLEQKNINEQEKTPNVFDDNVDNNYHNEEQVIGKDVVDRDIIDNENLNENNEDSLLFKELNDTIELDNEELNHEVNEENLFSEIEFDKPDEENKKIDQNKESIVDNQVNQLGSEKQDDLEKENEQSNQYEEPTVNNQVNQLELERQKALEEERISLEKRRKEEFEQKAREDLEKLRLEERLEKEKLEEQKIHEKVIEEQKKAELEAEVNKELENSDVSVIQSNELDEYERYDAKVLERILNDSRSAEFAGEKERLVTLWKHLISLTPIEKRGIAEMLCEGEIRAVGNHEFVITYANSSTCNQVMGRKFKRNSLKLLYDLLDGDYNYFALTNEIWLLKRQEYAGQYALGIKYPKLSPITDVTLKVVNETEDDDGVINNIKNIFGDEVIIKKRGENDE